MAEQPGVKMNAVEVMTFNIRKMLNGERQFERKIFEAL